MLEYKLTLPEHIEERAYLKDPSESSFISDLAFSLESDLDFLNTVCSFEGEIPLNAAVQICSIYGLEANKFVETAKKTYYILKQRATQLIKYVCKIFLEFLRGTTDAKAVYNKYEEKLLKYSAEFDKMKPSFDSNGTIEVRDPRRRLSFTTYIVSTTCHCLNSILDAMYGKKVKSKDSLEKVLIFARAIQLLNFSLSKVDSEKMVKDKGKMREFHEQFDAKLKEIVDDPNSFKMEPEKLSDTIKERTKVLKEVFKKDYPKESLNYKDSYLYVRTMNEMILFELFGIAKEEKEEPKQITQKSDDTSNKEGKFKLPEGAKPAGIMLTNNLSKDGKDLKLRPKSYKIKREAGDISPKTGYVKKANMSKDLDFKKLAKKIDVIEKEMSKVITEMDNDKLIEENNKREDMNEIMKVIMASGAQMAKVKDLISLSLSTFKGDMEVVLTENKKVGSILYQHKQ